MSSWETEGEQFRANLETLVESCGSPEALATRTGIPYFTIYNWRKKGQEPSVSYLLQMARSFKITVDDLLETVIEPEHLPGQSGGATGQGSAR